MLWRFGDAGEVSVTGTAAAAAIPLTVAEYASAIVEVGGGQFTSRFSEDGRNYFASLYGAPFAAIDQLIPEFRGRNNPSILIADPVGTLAADSGRWLSLYARAVMPAGKLNCTICVPVRPRPGKPPKPLLFQPPQQVLIKDWRKHVRDLGGPPEVLILYVSGAFDEVLEMVADACLLADGRKVLLACSSQLDALLVRHLFQAKGSEVSEVFAFELSNKTAQDLSTGAWWFSAIPPDPQQPEPPAPADLAQMRASFDRYRRQFEQVSRKEDADAIAQLYATRQSDLVDGKPIRAVRLSPTSGIDLDSGRFFSRERNHHDENFAWDEENIAPSGLSLAPQRDSQGTDGEDRLELALWLGRIAEQNDELDFCEADTDSALIGDEESDSAEQIQADPASSNQEGGDAPAASPEAMVLPPQAPRADPQQKRRSRISRAAGTVNVLALAALMGREGTDPEFTFNTARARILTWLGSKGFGFADPSRNSQVELPDGEVSIETDGASIWAIRFDDRRSMEDGAIWRVEATLLGKPVPAIGLRLIQIRSSEDAPPPVASGVPQVVATIAKEVGLEDAGATLLNSALRLSGNDRAVWLARLLLNPNRTQPVIVFSGDVDASADRLAARLAGVAHVVCVDSRISGQLIRAFGRDLSVFGNAVRLYRPGFDANTEPHQHPLWTLKGKQLPKWLATDIFEEACAISLEAGDLDDRAPSFQMVRSHLAEQRLSSSEQRLAALRQQAENIASSKDEQIEKLREIRTELEVALAEYKAKADEIGAISEQLRGELLATRRERDTALEEARQLRFQLDNRWVDPDAEYGDSEEQTEYPDSWDHLEAWVEVYCDDKLILHPMAAKAARESPFKDIPLAYKAMEYLVRYYIPMRTRDASDTDAYVRNRQALDELGLEESDVGTAQDMKRYKKEYRRQYDGKEITLDRHLKRGVGFGGEHQFRLYFHYDEAAAKVIVGHMPTHLTNRLTHNG